MAALGVPVALERLTYDRTDEITAIQAVQPFVSRVASSQAHALAVALNATGAGGLRHDM
mgnify:CR=1 FL=1